MKKISTLFFLPFLLILALSANAQVREISGKVTIAEDGSSLPGVSVRVKGTSTGATTDPNGNYRIQVANNEATLVFTFIGFSVKEVRVGTQTTVNVAMNTDSKQLEEVIVTNSFGIARQQKSLGYAAQGVNAEELNINRQSKRIKCPSRKNCRCHDFEWRWWSGSGCKHPDQGNQLD